jgi:polyisoprenyl-teichoic acid--peptidoglycan teichoic acid transferase
MKLNWKHYLILSIAILVAILGFLITRSLIVSWTFTDLPGIALVGDSTPENAGDSDAEITPEAVIPPSELPPAWDGASRVNILVMGLDYGDWAADRTGPSRTDSMILLTVDPITKEAGMLSIPRDLWVNIPGFEHGRINTAHALGETYKLPGGGPALAAKTVEDFLGVPVQYYAVVSFDAFTRMVDELGCIHIMAFEELDIDPVGKGNTIHLTKDLGYCMDGATLLAYARNRKTQGGDVDRARRTQQAIIALKDAVLLPENFPTLISKAPALYQELSSGIKTNLTFEDAMKLVMLIKDVSTENIKSHVIDYSMSNLASVMSKDGQAMSILVPIPDKIRELRDQMFAESGSIKPFAQGEPAQLAMKEGASLEILNGTYTAGLAGKTGDYFKSLGMNVAVVGNPDQIGYPRTMIIDHSGKPYMTKYLLDLFQTSAASQFQIQFDPASPADVTIILGEDWAVSNPMP